MSQAVSATVLLPTTGEKGPVIQYALASVLAQSVASIEVFVVGDGAGDSTRRIVREFQERDSRVRFFDFPKGNRRGETYRHDLLMNEARGRIVCYICDRDLWCHDHVEALLEALDNAEMAQSYRLIIRDIGENGARLQMQSVDLRKPADRRRFVAGREPTKMPGCLSGIGHTLAMYRHLDEGWTTTPRAVGTDHFMWRKFLRLRDCRFTHTSRPTMLWFGEKTWSEDAAVREPATRWWWERIRRDDWPHKQWEIALESMVAHLSHRSMLQGLWSELKFAVHWLKHPVRVVGHFLRNKT